MACKSVGLPHKVCEVNMPLLYNYLTSTLKANFSKLLWFQPCRTVLCFPDISMKSSENASLCTSTLASKHIEEEYTYLKDSKVG